MLFGFSSKDSISSTQAFSQICLIGHALRMSTLNFENTELGILSKLFELDSKNSIVISKTKSDGKVVPVAFIVPIVEQAGHKYQGVVLK